MIAALALAATQFEIGSIVPDGDSCEGGFFTPTDPDTGEPYSSIDGFQSAVVEHTEFNESGADRFVERRNAELRSTENGTVVQLEEVCS